MKKLRIIETNNMKTTSDNEATNESVAYDENEDNSASDTEPAPAPAPIPVAKKGKKEQPAKQKKNQSPKPEEVAAPTTVRARQKPTMFAGLGDTEQPAVAVPLVKLANNPDHPPIKVMLEQTMGKLNNNRKGISFREVKHYIHNEFHYSNETALGKAIKMRLASNEYIQVTGNGLNGKFKLAPKQPAAPKPPPKKETKPAKAAEKAPKKEKEKPKKQNTKPVVAMTKPKADKHRRSLKLEVTKPPKNAPKVTKAKSEKTPKAPKASAGGKENKKPVVKIKSGKVKKN